MFLVYAQFKSLTTYTNARILIWPSINASDFGSKVFVSYLLLFLSQ